MSSWIDRRINLPFRGGGNASSSDNFQHLDKADVELHLVKAQELRRLKTMRKKWFALYEDPDNPIDPTRKREHRKTRRRRLEGSGQGVEQGQELDESDILGDDEDHEEVVLPARLEYYDSEKKWREGAHPKKRIFLQQCFDINRKKETANQFVIAVYTLNECLDILFENEQDMEIWLDLMLCCKDGGRSIEGKIARPNFESVWSVDVIGFTPDQGSAAGSTGFQMSGPHRLCVNEGILNFYPLGSNEAKAFQMREIRKFGNDKRKFRLIIGSNSISGVGELSMFCKDREAAENLKQTILAQGAKVVPAETQDGHSRTSRRINRHLPPSQQPTRSDWVGESASNVNGRTRSYSDCNKKNATMAHSIPTQKTYPIQNSQQNRNRTISEGNSHLDGHHGIRGRGGWHRPNLISGSPLSPGSFVSSESAGSSNSVDSDTMAVGSFDNHKYGSSCITPSSEHPSTTTIIEESSAESCIDPANFRRNRIDEVSDDARRPSLPTTSAHDIGILYTPVECVSGASMPFTSVAVSSVTAPGSYASSPPSGTGVLYSTIVSSQDATMTSVSPPGPGSSDYMMMASPMPPAFHHQGPTNSGSSSSTSSLKRHTQIEPERKRLAMLGLEEDPFPALNTTGVTSPSSQSSYNPLEEEEGENDSAYLIMSPTGSSGGTLPKRGTTSSAVGIPSSSHHRRTGSSSFRSGSIEVREEEESTQYVTMSPTVTLGKSGYSRVDASANTSRGAIILGASPSAALTSHIPERLPLFEPQKRSTPITKSDQPTEVASGYMVMSPVNAESERTPKSSWLSEKFRASSVDTSGPPLLRSKDPLSNHKRDIFKRSSLCSEDEVPRGWSPVPPTQHGNNPVAQQNYNPMEDYEDFEPPSAPLYQQHHHTHHPHTRTSKSSSYIPISQTGQRRSSPASSSSVISGTPNSTEGAVARQHPPIIRSSSDDDLMDDLAAPSELNEDESNHPTVHSTLKSRILSAKSNSRASNSSLASRGSSSRCIDIPGGGVNKSTSSLSPNVSGQSSVASTANSSSMASWLGSLFRGRADSAFRNRSDSVPSRPAGNGRRRHRTQSEGENLEGGNA